MRVLVFGKHKNEMLEMTPESYIKWLATHRNVLSPEHRTFSDAAKELLEQKEKTMKNQLTVPGGKDAGDVRLIDGEYYIRVDSFYMNQYEMEEAYDVNIESGWYSNVRLAESDEDKAFVEKYLAEKTCKEQEGKSKIYKINNFSLFVPQVGQRVFYPATGKHGIITELSTRNHLVRVKKDGEKSAGWISPSCLDLVGNTNTTAFDLNEVVAK
jgi:hypothetical protein